MICFLIPDIDRPLYEPSFPLRKLPRGMTIDWIMTTNTIIRDLNVDAAKAFKTKGRSVAIVTSIKVAESSLSSSFGLAAVIEFDDVRAREVRSCPCLACAQTKCTNHCAQLLPYR